MQTRNNHERSFYNGEIAVVAANDPDARDADARRRRRPAADARPSETATLRLAYACSVHKMQGSQAPAIVIALARGHAPMLTRNLRLHRA